MRAAPRRARIRSCYACPFDATPICAWAPGSATRAVTRPLEALSPTHLLENFGVLDFPVPSPLAEVAHLRTHFGVDRSVDRHVLLEDGCHFSAQIDVCRKHLVDVAR